MIERASAHDAFLQAVLPEKITVLGRELDPFCFDHWCLLRGLNSPIISGGRVTLVDIKLAVKACSTASIDEFWDATRRPNFGWRLWDRLHLWESVADQVALFDRYFSNYVPSFPRWEQDGEADEGKCPPIFVCAARWLAAGHAIERVRRMPLGLMLAFNLAMDEAAGRAPESLMTDTDLAALHEAAL